MKTTVPRHDRGTTVLIEESESVASRSSGGKAPEKVDISATCESFSR